MFFSFKCSEGSRTDRLTFSRREKVAINPVKSRICELPGSGDGSSKIGYIKLTSFTQKASGKKDHLYFIARATTL